MPAKTSNPKTPAKIDPTYRRGDGYETPRAALYQKLERGRWTLRTRDGDGFVNDAPEPFAGIEKRA